jgi:acetyl-CoA carboxylase biotin carboxyl carrier protein
MTKPNDIDADLVKKLAGLLDETKLTEIEYAWGEFRLKVTRQPAAVHGYAPAGGPIPFTAVTDAAPPGAVADSDLAHHPGAVKSPMVGTVYLCPQPGEPPFVRVGDMVTMGQTLLIIEAMKVMNQIRAPKSGKLSRILVEDSGPVEYGHVVMVLD